MQTEKLSTLAEQNFEYETLNVEARIVVQQCTDEIKSLIRHTAVSMVKIGQKLNEVKEQLGHGCFMNWLKFEFNWSVSAATRFMQVSEQFKFVKLENLHIAVSALYLLAAPSTPEEARKEALERATKGEIITHTSAKEILAQHKKAAKLKVTKPVTVNVPPKEAEWVVSPTTMPLSVAQTLETKSAGSIKQFENEVPRKKIETPAYFQANNSFHHMASATNSVNHPPQNQAGMEIQSLFEIGRYLCIADFDQQEYRFFGEVAEVKEVSATDIEIVIKIPLKASVA